MNNDLQRYLLNGYLPTIGIETHVQFNTKTKLFAPVDNDARIADPNTLISHICLGLPGALPVLNEEAVRLACIAAFALNTQPQKFSKFDRKHYFYPDLPMGYQISQFDEPIILGGYIEISIAGNKRKIHLTRAHLEADAGKSTHPTGADYSLIDLNRAGTPLLEIVSEPEMHSAAEAKAYARELYLRMKCAKVSDVNLFYGNMRFDVNVSVSKSGELGIRSETKNLNSFRSVEKAVDYEIRRQIELLEKGKTIVQETRGWHDDKQQTFSQRSKEDAHDYRYFPDPDLPPIVLTEEYIAKVQGDLPAMPDEIRNKLSTVIIDVASIETLLERSSEEQDFVSLVLNAADTSSEFGAFVAKYITNEFLRSTDGDDAQKADLPSLEQFSQVFSMISEGNLNSTAAKTLLAGAGVGVDLQNRAEELNLLQVSDVSEVDAIVADIIAANPQAAKDVAGGEMKAIGFLVGQVMKASQGKANPGIAQELIKKQLGV